jgi:hypothetical protein
VAWIVRLVKSEGGGEELCADVMQINRRDDLGDIADLGLALAEGKLLLEALQQEIVAAQARGQVFGGRIAEAVVLLSAKCTNASSRYKLQ